MFSPAARILVVDPSEAECKKVTGLLTDIGFRNIQTATDPDGAWITLQHAVSAGTNYHVLLIDATLAKANHCEFMIKLREDAELKKLFVVVMGTYPIKGAPAVQGALPKPARLADIVRQLKRTDSEKTAA